MRDRVGTKLLSGLVLAAGLVLTACGGGGTEQRTADWQPRQRIPSAAEHWWWEPVERACEEDDDCRTGETCQAMRLGTCTGCPRGESAKICVGPDDDEAQRGRRASSR